MRRCTIATDQSAARNAVAVRPTGEPVDVERDDLREARLVVDEGLRAVEDLRRWQHGTVRAR